MGGFLICIIGLVAISVIFLLVTLMLVDDLNVGDKMYLFFDGFIPEMNRKATITKIDDSRIYIYGALPLPLNHVGRFYATGISSDDVKFIYVKSYMLVYFAKIAELLRGKK